jgi:FKBP-type peptidyl-prolyl cis-trans isomerase
MNRLVTIALLASLISCTHNQQPKKLPVPKSEVKRKLLGINQKLVDKDKEEILAYISRQKLTMVQSQSGLFYYIFGKAKGPKPKAGNVVVYHYRINLLDGTECYKSEPNKPESFVVGHGGVETGLEEAIKLMHKGQNAILILPPHLAHGLIGDLDKIPPRSSIIYEVSLIDVLK